MRPNTILSTPLVIAIMAGAIGAFLFLIDTAVNSDETQNGSPVPIRVNTDTANTNTAVNENVNSATNSNANTNAPAATYFPIEEWGVEFAVSDNLLGLVYAISTKSATEGHILASFSTVGLMEYGCAPQARPVGGLARYERPEGSGTYIKIGDFYYYFVPSEVTCSDQPAAIALQSQVQAELEDSWLTLRRK